MNEKELTCLVSEEISNQFVEAIKNDNVAELRTLLEEGITIDSQIDYKFRNRRSLLCVGGDIKAGASCCSIRALSRSASIYSTGHITAKIQNLSAFASLKKIFGTHVLKSGFCHL